MLFFVQSSRKKNSTADEKFSDFTDFSATAEFLYCKTDENLTFDSATFCHIADNYYFCHQ